MTGEILRYGDETIEYRVLPQSNLVSKIRIHVHPDGSVEVRAPEDEDPANIRTAVRIRARWVTSQVIKARERHKDLLPRQYISGESHFYLGRRYQLKVIDAATSKNAVPKDSCVKLIAGQLQVKTLDTGPGTVKGLLSKWYRQHAHQLFQRRLEELSTRVTWVGKQTPQIKLLVMKKHWGSCSPSGRIVLNPYLVKAPSDCVNYVLLHELCHLKEHNHSPQFWRLMDGLMPDWRHKKKRLDEMAEGLLND